MVEARVGSKVNPIKTKKHNQKNSNPSCHVPEKREDEKIKFLLLIATS
jgi:hypothetical protein